MATLNIGDILMLSQRAWQISRTLAIASTSAAAKHSQSDAPSEPLLDIEAEVGTLAEALKMLAEAVFADDGDGEERVGSGKSKGTGERKAGAGDSGKEEEKEKRGADEESKDEEENGEDSTGLLVRTSAETRAGIEAVLGSCRRTLRALEKSRRRGEEKRAGGDPALLREVLRAHASAVVAVAEALRSRSRGRLAEAVHLAMGKVGSDGDQNAEGGAIGGAPGAASSPMLEPRRDSHISSVTASSLSSSGAYAWEDDSQRRQTQQQQRWSPDIAPLEGGNVSFSYPGRRKPRRHSLSEDGHATNAAAVPGSPEWSLSSRRQSTVAAAAHWRIEEAADEGAGGEQQYYHYQPLSPRSLPPLQQQQKQHRTDSRLSFTSSALPSPAIPPDPDPAAGLWRLSLGPAAIATEDVAEKGPLERSETTKSERGAFEKEAFRDSAILCELRGRQVEYLQPPKDENMPLDVEMGEAMGQSRILVVRKRIVESDGSTRFATSIWSLSNDGAVRLQQELADGVEIIPHASYFDPEKISLPLVADLKFHDKTYGAKPIKVEQTTWINYIFEDVRSGTLFQNEIVGRILVGVFKTEKTLRIHEGLSGVLAYQEQMCGMENLRLWADPESGRVLAMIHFSAVFRPGYLSFYLNSSAHPIRVKDEGGKEIKIKGLRIPLDRNRAGAGRSGESGSGKVEGKKWITGAKVEFASDIEKFLFLEKVKEVQQTMVALLDV